MESTPLKVKVCDPGLPEASRLMRELSRELAKRYEYVEEGSGSFRVEDLAAPRSVFVVGWLGDQAVACGAMRPIEEKVAELKRMYVAREFRGRGYSKTLLAELERLARQAGYGAVRLETGDKQPESIGLYEKSGYVRIPRYGVFATNERSVCFEKKLTS